MLFLPATKENHDSWKLWFFPLFEDVVQPKFEYSIEVFMSFLLMTIPEELSDPKSKIIKGIEKFSSFNSFCEFVFAGFVKYYAEKSPITGRLIKFYANVISVEKYQEEKNNPSLKKKFGYTFCRLIYFSGRFDLKGKRDKPLTQKLPGKTFLVSRVTLKPHSHYLGAVIQESVDNSDKSAHSSKTDRLNALYPMKLNIDKCSPSSSSQRNKNNTSKEYNGDSAYPPKKLASDQTLIFKNGISNMIIEKSDRNVPKKSHLSMETFLQLGKQNSNPLHIDKSSALNSSQAISAATPVLILPNQSASTQMDALDEFGGDDIFDPYFDDAFLATVQKDTLSYSEQETMDTILNDISNTSNNCRVESTNGKLQQQPDCSITGSGNSLHVDSLASVGLQRNCPNFNGLKQVISTDAVEEFVQENSSENNSIQDFNAVGIPTL